MNPESNQPHKYQRALDVVQATQAPPADAETPDLPPDILELIHETYGVSEPQRPRDVVEITPSFWSQILALFTQPKFALSLAAIIALIGITVIMLPSSDDSPNDLRGPDDSIGNLPAYWLAEKAEPQPTGLGMPKFEVINNRAALPATGEYLLFEPSEKKATRIKDGQPQVTISITTPEEPAEWLDAHRQLKLP